MPDVFLIILYKITTLASEGDLFRSPSLALMHNS